MQQWVGCQNNVFNLCMYLSIFPILLILSIFNIHLPAVSPSLHLAIFHLPFILFQLIRGFCIIENELSNLLSITKCKNPN